MRLKQRLGLVVGGLLAFGGCEPLACGLLDFLDPSPGYDLRRCKEACARVRQCGLTEWESLFCNADDPECHRVPHDECPRCISGDTCENLAHQTSSCRDICVFMQR